MMLRDALRRDLPEVVDIWFDAFSNDPWLRWIARSDDEWATFGPEWLAFVADQASVHGHTYLGGHGEAAAAWIPPGHDFITADDLPEVRRILAAHVGEARAEQAVATMGGAGSRAPDAPHWTLLYLGVRSTSQSRGVGGVIVAPMLDVADADGLPSSLVSSNPRNVPFYERLGFQVVAEVPTPDGATALRPMQRPGASR